MAPAALENIVQIQDFTAAPDVAVNIQVSQVVLLMPIFRWNGDHYVDAVGDYDLCMSPDGINFEFINRRSTTERYAYRYISVFYLTNRLGKQNR